MSRILTDWLDSFLTYTNNSEPSHLFRTWVGVSTVASVLKRKCVFNWGTVRLFPNMYIVLVGPPAARKGTAMGFGLDFMMRAEIKMAADSITKEALVRNIKDAYSQDITEDGKTFYHCSYSIVSPELSVFLGQVDTTMIRWLTDWFDCGKGPAGVWTYETKGQGTDQVSGIWINLLGATTPEQIGMLPAIIETGLASRMIMVYQAAKEKTCTFPFLTQEELKIGEQLYFDLEKIHMLKGEFKFSKNWMERYEAWYNNNDANPPFRDRRLARYCDRRQVHLIKLCMIMSASRSDEMVLRLTDIERAIHLLEITEMTMPEAFGAMGEDKDIKVLSYIMQEVGINKRLTFEELTNRHYFDAVNPQKLEWMVRTLENMKFLTRRQVTTDAGTQVFLEYIEKDKRNVN